MRQNFIFVFILLVTLSMVNAQLHKRTTSFGACPVDPSATTLLDVKLSPDPIVLGKSLDVTLSGKLLVDVPENSQDINADVAFLDSDYVPVVDPTTVNLCTCKGIKCPIKAGTVLSCTVSAVQVPNSLPKGTTIVADISQHGNFLGCALSDPVA